MGGATCSDDITIIIIIFIFPSLLHSPPTSSPPQGQYLDVNEDGTFTCVVCGNELFKTTKKFESGSGWPSFSDVASQSSSVVRIVDESYGMVRTEVVCGKCSAHLGHMFDDGPKDTCLRYCINGASLQFSGKGAGSKANERVEDGEKEEEDGVGEMKQKVVEGEREEEKAEVVGEKEKAEVEDGEKEEDGGVGEMKQKEAEGEREEEKAEVVGEKEKAEVEDGEKEEEAGVGEMKQNEVEGEREEEKAEAVGEKEKAEVEGENEEEGEGEREGKQKEERSKEEEGTARGEGVEEGQCESAEPK